MYGEAYISEEQLFSVELEEKGARGTLPLLFYGIYWELKEKYYKIVRFS